MIHRRHVGISIACGRAAGRRSGKLLQIVCREHDIYRA
jgi:hypothetical protein